MKSTLQPRTSAFFKAACTITVFLLFCSDLFAQTLKTEASLGRYGEDCSGRGICSFSAVESYTSPSFKSLQTQDSTITLTWEFNNMTTTEKTKLFGVSSPQAGVNYYFIVDREMPLSQSDKSILKMSSYTAIPVQSVPVKVLTGTAQVKLILKK